MKMVRIEEALMSCSDCVYYKNEIEKYPCRDCRNKCHFRRKGAMMIDYDMITNASLTAAMNNIPKTYNKFKRLPDIKNVIFNDPATIVFWSDGTKTVVKCQDGEPYDAEKGLAMAISKKALGNQGNYCNVFKKWLPEEDETGSINIEYNGVNLLDLLNTSFDIKKEK